MLMLPAPITISSVSGPLNSVSGLLSSVSGLLNSVSGLLSSVSGLLSSVSGLLSSVSGPLNSVSGLLTIICSLTIVKRMFCAGEGSTLTRTDTHKHHRLMNAAKKRYYSRARMRIYC